MAFNQNLQHPHKKAEGRQAINKQGVNLILGVWPDGRVIRSGELVNGKASYHIFHLAKPKTKEILSSLNKMKLLEKPMDFPGTVSVSAPFWVINLKDGSRSLHLMSCERHPNNKTIYGEQFCEVWNSLDKWLELAGKKELSFSEISSKGERPTGGIKGVRYLYF